MKKLFALVLSLALVVAFAVPALATGWASLDTAPVYKDITLNVYGLQIVANTSKVGSLYEELKTPYPVVKGTELHFLVELTIPYTKLSPATKALMAEKNLDVVIDTTNMEINTTKSKLVAGAKVSSDLDVITDSYNLTDYTETKTWNYEVWANAKSDKEAKVVATAGFYNVWEENGHTMKIFNAEAKNVMTVYNNGDNFGVVTPAGNFVRFPVNGKKIDTKGIMINDQWLITYGSQNKTEVDFYDVNAKVWASASADTFKKVNAIYEEVFKFLGFQFAECDYMTAAHFEKFFGTIGEVSASYTWNSGMVVVNPVDPKLPQTGDNASIIGFAMIAVAMVAAAVVTFKKVRA